MPVEVLQQPISDGGGSAGCSRRLGFVTRQEGLVNVRKHSRAHNTVVRSGREESKRKLVIDGDGHGFEFAGRLSGTDLDAARKGPLVIKEPVPSIGAELTVDSTSGRAVRDYPACWGP